MTTAVRPRSAGTSSVERQMCTARTLLALSDEDRHRPGDVAPRLVEREELAVRREHRRQPVERDGQGSSDPHVRGLRLVELPGGEAGPGRVRDREQRELLAELVEGARR